MIVASYASSLINFRGHLIEELVSSGHVVIAAAPVPSTDYHIFLQQLKLRGASFFPIPISRGGVNLFADFLTFFSILRLCLSARPQLVLAYTIKPVIYSGLAILCIRRFCRIRFVALITGLGYAFISNQSTSFMRRFLRQIVCLLYRFALIPVSDVVFQNPDDQATFVDLNIIPSSSCTHRVYGSGVDLSLYKPQPLPSAPIFLMLARLLVDKGIREYISAARQVKLTFPNCTFCLAGMLDHNPTSISQAELDSWISDGVIEYLGNLHDVRTALSSCKFFVLPSYREGTPRSVLEALATARPIITTDVPGCRETVVHARNGFLVPPRDVGALAEAMIKMLNTAEPKILDMAQESLSLACQKYDVHKVNSHLLTILNL